MKFIPDVGDYPPPPPELFLSALFNTNPSKSIAPVVTIGSILVSVRVHISESATSRTTSSHLALMPLQFHVASQAVSVDWAFILEFPLVPYMG